MPLLAVRGHEDYLFVVRLSWLLPVSIFMIEESMMIDDRREIGYVDNKL